ncbi:hypothetical protein IAI10_02875 [Clostridium sp. 19966]|uniref:hypothetical protein n=1 Tax=Clostridium sp. 19966 TaxID=2768166 RepID=UPI0028DDA856|nr:hypothetical protein [Clostridium sp. 19966]MDT8715601.1 hypothetical protein [Clostridium sp. 19966]
MDINKAIKKQHSSYKRFMLIMCFIFFALPVIMFLAQKINIFFIAYLFIIELLIICAIIIRMDTEKLDYDIKSGRLKITQGLKKRQYNIFWEKVAYVHAKKNEEKKNIDIVILTTTKSRNKHIRPVSKEFLKRNAQVSYEYNKLKTINPEENYYYMIISRGGNIKYKLLTDIYKVCVKAKYSKEAIEVMKACKQ